MVSFSPYNLDCISDKDEWNCRIGRWVEVRVPMPDELCLDKCHHRAFHLTPRVDVGPMHVDIESQVDHLTEEIVWEGLF